MGIGTDGDDLAAQLPEPPQVGQSRKEVPDFVHAAGVDLHPLALPHEDAQNFVDQFPVILRRNDPGGGIAGGFGNEGHVTENIEAAAAAHAVQHGFKVTPLDLPGVPAPPKLWKVGVDPVHTVDGAKDKVVWKGSDFRVHFLRKFTAQAQLHTVADGNTRNGQIFIGGAVLLPGKGNGAVHHSGAVVAVIGEADFPQSGVLCGKNHGKGIGVCVIGDPGVHMKVKHIFTPRAG